VAGGKKVILTGTITAMLMGNLAPSAQGHTTSVGAGQTVNGETITLGYQSVYSNGATSNITIAGGDNTAVQDVWAGGRTSSTIISGGAYTAQNIHGSGSAFGTIIISGAQSVYTSGHASGTIISGGAQFVASGALVNFTEINALGSQVVSSGGIVSNTTINGGRQILSGATAVSATINGGNQYVGNGGSADFTTINSGGSQQVAAAANNTIINSSGTQDVIYGGLASNTTINGGYQDVYGGASNTTINGGSQNVHAGASANYTSINSGGSQFLSGNAYSTAIQTGGYQTVSSGAIASSAFVYSGATQRVAVGGQSIGVSQYAGGNINASVVGGDTSTVILGNREGGASFSLLNGVASNFAIYNGGSQVISVGGIANDTKIYSGGIQLILGSASANGAEIYSGGVQNVSAYGNAASTVISGGRQNILAAGSASGTNVAAGGVQNVSANGNAVSTTISGTILTIGTQNVAGIALQTIVRNGIQNVLSGGSAVNTTLNNNAAQIVSSGASAVSTVINNRGTQNISADGYAISAAVYSGGVQNVSANGNAVSTVISGGTQNILTSGSANGAEIYSGGVQNVSANGNAVSTIISGGTQNILTSGSASGAEIYSGGVQNVSENGNAVSTVISGGTQNILTSGSANGANVAAGGVQNISENGVAVSTVISGAVLTIGTQNVAGIALQTNVRNGAQNVLAGGLAVNTTLNNNAAQIVSSGASAVSTVINNLGTQNILSNGYASGAAVYAGGVQNILAYASAVSTIISGTVTEAAVQTVAGDAVETTVANGIQEVLAGGYADNTTLNSNGSQVVFSGGIIQGNTIINNSAIVNLSAGAIAYGDINVNSGGTLNGKIDANLANLNISGGKWTNTKDSIVNNLVLDGASVDMRDGANGGNILTIQNLSASNNPVVEMNAALGSENSPSDLIKVTGNYNGDILLKVTNVGGSGGQMSGDGIKVVDIDAAAGATGTFALDGRKIDTGAYSYGLFKGNGSAEQQYDYFLRSLGALTNTFKTMANVPIINTVMAKTQIASLENRLGDIRALGNMEKLNGFWAKAGGASATLDDLTKTDISIYNIEAGYDKAFALGGGKLYTGLALGYADAGEIKTKQESGEYAKASGAMPSVGLYAAFLSEKNFYIDALVKGFFTSLEMTNYAANGTELKYEPSRSVFAFALEGGKTFNKGALKIEPKAGILLMNAGSGDVQVENGIGNLKYDAMTYANAKIGITLGWTGIEIFKPVIEVFYVQGLTGKDKITYDNTTYEADIAKSGIEARIGVNVKLTDVIAIFGNINYETNEAIQAAGGNLGARYSF
jgi:outer membrane autotransporter protein